MVPVAKVGGLVGQDMAQGGRVGQGRWGHIDSRTEESEEAGGVHGVGDIDGKPFPAGVHRLPGPTQAAGKAEVGEAKAQAGPPKPPPARGAGALGSAVCLLAGWGPARFERERFRSRERQIPCPGCQRAEGRAGPGWRRRLWW